MTITNRTPGPWTANGEIVEALYIGVEKPFFHTILSCPSVLLWPEERAANAKLAAASVDLLEALIEVEQMIHAGEMNEGTMQVVRAAIEKALGGAA